MPCSYPRVEESGKWKLTQELKLVFYTTIVSL